ncbi:MAG: GDSL-type esterase/lipase family protein [Patescibacteria group bacterium]
MNKILVFGDSIAYGKWDSEGGWVARLRKYVDEKFNIGKEGNVQVYNLGIPGEVMVRMAERVEREFTERIFPNEKNLVIIAAGINDSCTNNWMTLKQTPESEFKEAVVKIIRTVRNYSCDVCIVGLTPVDERLFKNLLFNNKDVKKYDGYISEVCEEQKVSKIELYDELEKKGYKNMLLDSVHPKAAGHKMIANVVISYLENEIATLRQV